jgi:hypothetical protein
MSLHAGEFGTRVAFSMREAWDRMLKISTHDTPNQRRLVLEGKLITPWTDELRRACERARENLECRELVVDLKNLMVISQEGENLLAVLMKERVKFRVCSVFAKQVLRHVVRRARAQLQEATP